MRDHYEVVVVGATMAGIGYACAQRDALVLERTEAPGNEFINAIEPGTGFDLDLGEAGADLKARMETHNILCGERLHLPGLSAILFDMIQRKRLEVQFLHEVLSVQAVADGFAVRILNAGGISTIHAGAVLDTSTQRLSAPGSQVPLSNKRLNAMVMRHIDDTEALPECQDLRPSRFDSEGYLSVPLPITADWPEAREALIRRWENRREGEGWKISSIATQFAYDVAEGPEVLASRWVHLPSAGFANPLAAFDAGNRFDWN